MTLEVRGGAAAGGDLEGLKRALLRDDELRSIDVDTEAAQPAAGEDAGHMGAISEVLAVSFGAGGSGVAVVQAVCAWLRSQRQEISVKLTTKQRTIEISVSQAKDSAQVIALLHELSGDRPPTGP